MEFKKIVLYKYNFSILHTEWTVHTPHTGIPSFWSSISFSPPPENVQNTVAIGQCSPTLEEALSDTMGNAVAV